MKASARNRNRGRQGASLLAYLIFLLIATVSIATVAGYVAQVGRVTQRSSNLIAAEQYAEGGAVIAVQDLNTAVTNGSLESIGSKLASISYAPYTLNSSLGAGLSNVYERTILAGAPFDRQSVDAQIWITNSDAPSGAQIVATATVGGVTQKATVNVAIRFGYGAAILSVNDGTSETSASKRVAQDGNVTVNANGRGATIAYGGTNGWAILANGRANLSTTNTEVIGVQGDSISMTNYSAGTPIPDYTSQGTSNTLFNVNRFIAVADATTGGYAPSGNNHFTNLADFFSAAETHTSVNPMQGVIVVDVEANDKNMNDFGTKTLPDGINVEGSLIFNFLGSGWNPTTSKIVIDCPVNINPADLSHLEATNPATYTSGYPPTYTDSTKNPANIGITSQVDPATGKRDFRNFTASDDLPALVYTIGVVDLHNDLNISGCMYTPSYMEIENKHSGNTQYMAGELIMGNGIYYENNSAATSIITYDPNAVKTLATAGTAAKAVFVTYWQ